MTREVKAAAADLAAQLAEVVLADRAKGLKSDPMIDQAVGQLADRVDQVGVRHHRELRALGIHEAHRAGEAAGERALDLHVALPRVRHFEVRIDRPRRLRGKGAGGDRSRERREIDSPMDDATIAHLVFAIYQMECRSWLVADRPNVEDGLARLRETLEMVARGICPRTTVQKPKRGVRT